MTAGNPRRTGDTALTAKEKLIHEKGLVAVLEAYGWHDQPGDEQILERLVLLNTQRAAEEAQGQIRWLRPAFQASEQTQTSMAGPSPSPARSATATTLAANPPRANRHPRDQICRQGEMESPPAELLATLGRARQLDDGLWLG